MFVHEFELTLYPQVKHDNSCFSNPPSWISDLTFTVISTDFTFTLRDSSFRTIDYSPV